MLQMHSTVKVVRLSNKSCSKLAIRKVEYTAENIKILTAFSVIPQNDVVAEIALSIKTFK